MRVTGYSAHYRVGSTQKTLYNAPARRSQSISCNRGVAMKRFCAAIGISIMLGVGGHAQTNVSAPAEAPPEGFEGREFVDSRGCVFMRSTFGGAVTWVPRFGPDRQIVCGLEPSLAAVTEQVPAAPEPEAESETVQAVVPPAPAVIATARRAATPQRRAVPRADASGRHPSCPAKAPYGQLVDTALGRPLVRCVTSPSLFIDPYFDSHAVPPSRTAPRTGGRMVQVGSFAVPSNATRLHARLENAGLPVRTYQSRGLTVVSVGPFSNHGQTQSALAQVRGMGFSDAFSR